MSDKVKEQALKYHSSGRPGKLEVNATKPCVTAKELSLAYSPGVAHPCLEIADNPEDVFKYTAKGNLVGVVSNGTAVLGLGNIGPLAGKPVMEGKAILFKRFADIDVFDIELDCKTVDEMVTAVKAMEPTFGGINLEDIKAPECFEIERQLQKIMDIPVFHDDQHGTAIITAAGFLNSLEITQRRIEDTVVVFSGAGAAAVACGLLLIQLGVKRKNLYMCDSKGVIYKGRPEGMNKYKELFAISTDKRTLADALDKADAFIGCSAKGVVSQDMVKSMADKPIIFAMANPDPEIMPEDVLAVRNDAIIATGRTDYPNQVNNVLGFPFIFRGALDVRARKITEEMKIAAVRAIADLAKEDVPDDVKLAYGNKDFTFGPEYVIPKPFDKRVLTRVAPAVAKAAMECGVARIEITDFAEYARSLEQRLEIGGALMNMVNGRLKNNPTKKIIFSEGTNARVLQAVNQISDDKLISPMLFGNTEAIHKKMEKMQLGNLKEIPIIDPSTDERYSNFVSSFHDERKRSGASKSLTKDLMKRGDYFCSMMVKQGFADGMITGTTQNYPDCIRPILRVAGSNKKLSGTIILVLKNKILFLGDCTIQQDPNEHDLVDIAQNTIELYQGLMGKDPSVAFLSYSSFGSNRNAETKKISKAAEKTKSLYPKLEIEGEIQADIAINKDLMEKLFDFSDLKSSADILIFPNLMSANIAYKLISQLTKATAIGPILSPMNYPINIVQRTSSVSEIVNMTKLTAAIGHQKKDLV